MSISKSDEGYESDKSDKSVPNQDLLNQISSLKKQLQVYQDFKEADLKIKEKYKQEIKDLQQENKSLKEKASQLEKASKNQANPVANIKHEEPTSPKLYLFTCSICDQNKKSQLHLAKVNGLGIDPTQLQKICDYCLKRVDIIKEREEEFF